MDYSLTKLSIKSNEGRILSQMYSRDITQGSTHPAQAALRITGSRYYDLALKYVIHPRLITPRVPELSDNPFAEYGFNPWIELAPGNHLFPMTEDDRPDLSSILEAKQFMYNQFMEITGYPLIPFMNLTDEILRIVDDKVRSSSNPFLASLKMRYYNDNYIIK